MYKTIFALLTLSMLSAPASALAAGAMKPGLWEMTMKSDAMRNMPKMSPDQMEMMRKMGVNMPQMNQGGIVTKVCITKEMADRDQNPQMAQNEPGCQMKNYKRQGNGYSMDMVCDGPDMKGTGVVKGTYAGDSSFNSTYDFKGTAQGHPVNQHQETSGKWLGADCGTVKPMGGAAKK